ncbi:MAG: hypothetical protein ACJ788_17505 [Ktedonobacteraceae bacterium]
MMTGIRCSRGQKLADISWNPRLKCSMKELRRVSILVLCLIFALTTLLGCGNLPDSQDGAGSLQVQETNTGAGDQEMETIHLNNCNGKADASQLAERGSTVQLEGGTQLGVNVSVVTAAVNGQYTTGAQRIKSITLTAPPGTNMEFTLRWMLEERTGQVTRSNINGTANYRYLVPVSVDIVDQRDQGCGQVSQPPDPSTELASLRPDNMIPPTAMPPAPDYKATITALQAQQPTPVVEATATILTDTPPGTILEQDQTWHQDGWELRIQEVSRMSSLIMGATFELKSMTSRERDVRVSPENFTMADNQGHILQRRLTCGTSTLTIDMYKATKLRLCNDITSSWVNVDLGDPAITEVLVEVSGVSTIQSARWRIPIYH